MAGRSSRARRLLAGGLVGLATAAIATPAQARHADGRANLALAAAPVASQAAVGDRLTYELSATNSGEGIATGVLLKGSVEGPASFLSAHTDRGECAVVGRTVACALGTLAPQGRADATVVVETSGPGAITSSFSVSANEPDADPAGNAVTSRTNVTLPSESVQLPAAGPLVWSQVAARSAPREDAQPLLVFHQLRRDLLPQIVFAVGSRSDAEGRLWYRVELPMRPNGRFGWIRAAAASVQRVQRMIIVDRSARRLTLVEGARTLVRTRVAVGRPGMETPVGNFYVTAKFKPTEPILGAFAIETSAYSRLSEWPGGGIVGIHGTPMPWLLGQAVSHGCVRVANAAIERVARLAPLGTPVRIVD